MKLEYEKLLYNVKFKLFGKSLIMKRQSFEYFKFKICFEIFIKLSRNLYFKRQIITFSQLVPRIWFRPAWSQNHTLVFFFSQFKINLVLQFIKECCCNFLLSLYSLGNLYLLMNTLIFFHLTFLDTYIKTLSLRNLFLQKVKFSFALCINLKITSLTLHVSQPFRQHFKIRAKNIFYKLHCYFIYSSYCYM